VSADWFYDTVEAIDDAGIAVSGVIVDGVNDIPTAIVDFLEVSGSLYFLFFVLMSHCLVSQ
jgi:hypothetical protein